MMKTPTRIAPVPWQRGGFVVLLFTLPLLLLGCDLLPAAQIATPTPTVPIVHQVAATETTIDNGSISVTCPPGELVLSGGWLLSNPGWRVLTSRRVNSDWMIEYYQLNINNFGALTVTAYAMCLANPPAGALLQEVKADVDFFQPGYPDEAIATCPNGYMLVGGGFHSGPRTPVFESWPGPVNGSAYLHRWHAKALPPVKPLPPDIYSAFATCLFMPGWNMQVTFNLPVNVHFAAPQGTAAVACPIGTYLTAGGFTDMASGEIITESAEEINSNSQVPSWVQINPQSTMWVVKADFVFLLHPIKAVSLCLTLGLPKPTPSSTPTPTPSPTPTVPPPPVPTVSITGPSPSPFTTVTSTGTSATSIALTFRADATPGAGASSVTVTWVDSLDGTLGTGTILSHSLSSKHNTNCGADTLHVVMAKAQNNLGGMASATVTVIVHPACHI